MNILLITGLLWGCSALIFGLVMWRRPRTLWSGFTFFWLLVFTAIFMISIVFTYSGWISVHPFLFMILGILAILALFGLLLFPFLVILTFFVEGIQVIVKEGASWTNFLSLAFALGLIVYMIGFPLLAGGSASSAALALYAVVGLAVLYMLCVLTVFCFSALLNLIHVRKRHDLDYIVVLGSGIMQDRITLLLAARINKGIELLKANPCATLILSGGQGSGESIPEGEAMYEYCLQQGVDALRMKKETASKNTEQNLLYSYDLIKDPDAKIALVTTRYHVFRALVLARRLGIRCIGYGSRTKWYFTLNALLREFAGYLSLTWRFHLRVLAVLEIPNLLILLVMWTFQ
ncbi:MAG TPA: hypothetical protein DCP49_00190 [Erysipelotrichaceae bacterium]|nr:hypothetical protein [Erysipelotrichaceae bacterium]